jgi:hypothetical protein
MNCMNIVAVSAPFLVHQFQRLFRRRRPPSADGWKEPRTEMGGPSARAQAWRAAASVAVAQPLHVGTPRHTYCRWSADRQLLPRAQLAAALRFGDDHRFFFPTFFFFAAVSVRPDVMGV